jgi:hypothetical protein
LLFCLVSIDFVSTGSFDLCMLLLEVLILFQSMLVTWYACCFVSIHFLY